MFHQWRQQVTRMKQSRVRNTFLHGCGYLKKKKRQHILGLLFKKKKAQKTDPNIHRLLFKNNLLVQRKSFAWTDSKVVKSVILGNRVNKKQEDAIRRLCAECSVGVRVHLCGHTYKVPL